MDAASFTFILLCFAGCLNYGLMSNEEQKIIGGRPTTIQQVPYLISVRINNRHMCGGCIISKQWVVTAAHCFGNVADLVKSTTICSGSSFYKNCTVYTVDKVIIHEQYNPRTFDYDITVVHVNSPFNNGMQPIALPSSGASNAAWGTISGWGYYRKNSDGSVEKILSDQVQYAQVPLVSKTECPKYFPSGSITPRMVCYGYLEGGRDTCQGDSGGPLVNAGTLYGVTSWGQGCADKNSPGVYTDVIYFKSWVTWYTGVN